MMTRYMYVTLSGEDRIAIYTADQETGRVTKRGDVPVSGRPAPLALDPERRYLYVGRRESNLLSSYRIDPIDGNLTPVSTAPLESDPCYLATDRRGRYLLGAYYGAGATSVHGVGEDGHISPEPIEWIKTHQGAHSIQTDRSNSFAFLPHIAGEVGPNLILQYRFDEETGRLTPNDPPQVVPEENAGPRHYCFHPSLDVIYFSNEQGGSVTAYRFDPKSGTLSAFQTVPTLPDGYDRHNTCAQIQITPSGRFLYAPNRGHNSIAGFSVSPDDGRLTRTDITPTEPIPRAFSLDPDGRFLYATGLESGKMAVYRIGEESGGLGHLETYDVGEEPMWVLITDLSP